MSHRLIVCCLVLFVTGCSLLPPPPPPGGPPPQNGANPPPQNNANPPPQSAAEQPSQPEQPSPPPVQDGDNPPTQDNANPPPQDNPNPPPQEPAGEPIAPESETAVVEPSSAPSGGFTLTSPVMANGGQLPATFTCDGQNLSPPLAWQGAPAGTVSYALAMHHIPGPGDTHWYWVVYNIPPTTLSIEAGSTTFGTFGTNSVNRDLQYAPPCSRGPGAKLYTITVYALSAVPDLPNPAAVDRDTLLAAIADKTLAEAHLDVTYERGQDQGAAVPEVAPDNSAAAPVTASGTECDPQGVFDRYSDYVHISCDDIYLHVETETGQPMHEMMRGITAWILRVPLPFSYTGDRAWKLPRQPRWQDGHTAAHARGPIAMAVNGVPIYHFDKRPDVALDDSYVYDSKFDTVQQGELDHCGGHAGQGEDYHYHTAPVCLLDNHDLNQPIGYTLGGGQIFYGTGADDYYGEGKYNHINNLPPEPLDECNGLRQADGSYVYYTTHDPPYTIGCYHEEVDWALQIEPRQMRDLGEFGRNATEIVSLTVQGDVRTLLFRTDRAELNAVVYQPSAAGPDCWDFQFRTNVDQPVAAETHCRVE